MKLYPQILLSDPDHPNVFKRVFDLERKDLNPDGSCDREAPFEARFVEKNYKFE